METLKSFLVIVVMIWIVYRVFVCSKSLKNRTFWLVKNWPNRKDKK